MLRVICLFLAVSAAGCKKSTPPPAGPPEVVDVAVVDRTAQPDQVGLDLAALTARAADTIGKAGGMHVSDGGAEASKRRYKLRVEVRTEGAEDAAAKKGVMRALVTARLVPVGAEVGALSFEQTAVGEHVYEVGKRGDAQAA